MRKQFLRAAVVAAALGAVTALIAVARGDQHPAPGLTRALRADLYSGHVDREQALSLVRTSTVNTGPDDITPAGSGTIGPPPNASSVSFDGIDRDANTDGPDNCNAPADPPNFAGHCDDYLLTVNTPQRTGTATVNLTFTGPEDYDLYVYDAAEHLIGSSTGTNASAESVTIPCPSNQTGVSPYKIRVVYFQTFAADGQKHHTTASYVSSGTCPLPVPSYVDNALGFAPATLVSAHFLGVEPQTLMERVAPWTPANNPGGISNDRIFIDWPLSSRSNIGQLNRSTDGGDSFRLLVDQTCAARSRPNCATGGGGDTESDVNLKNGNVFFSDQEALANEAAATSTNHGDTFVNQTPISNTTSATDRQWIAATDSTTPLAAAGNIEAFFMYHVPPTAYVHAIPESTHLPAPQPEPQLTNVAQSGQPKVDNNPSSPGHGWIYYPFNEYVLTNGGVSVATARSDSFQLPTNWHVTHVAENGATSFPWIAIDSAGNAYLSWDDGGRVFYAFSDISDPRNNPNATPTPGVPGTIWSTAVEITPPSVKSAVFPEITAGADPGKIGVTYMGTTEHTGVPDDAATTVHWNVYAAVVTGANTSTPVVSTGLVSHRFVHRGNICTGGTLCGIPPVGDPERDDRSLADMIDVGFDSDGRLGVVYQDNQTASFQDKPRGTDTDPEDFSPFVYFAKETSGPTLLSATSPVNIAIPRGARDDAASDAKWPNTQAGTNVPALDIRRVSLALEGANIVAHMKLQSATTTALSSALASYNAGAGTQPAERLQFIVRFNSNTDAYHVSYEVPLVGLPRAFGGKLNTNTTAPGTDPGDDGIVNPGSPQSLIASGYHTDPNVTVTATVSSDEIVLSVPAQALGLVSGSELYSVTGFATAGPLEQVEQAQAGVPQNAAYVMRTVDASPPFDTTLGAPTAVGVHSFSARKSGRKVVVRWSVGTRARDAGFNVYRGPATRRVRLNKHLIPVSRRSYAWVDGRGRRGTRYWLQEVGVDGSRAWHGPATAR